MEVWLQEGVSLCLRVGVPGHGVCVCERERERERDVSGLDVGAAVFVPEQSM